MRRAGNRRNSLRLSLVPGPGLINLNDGRHILNGKSSGDQRVRSSVTEIRKRGHQESPARAHSVVLPLGTANDFARSIGLSVEDLTAALLIVAVTATSPIDLGLFDGRPFVNMLTGGFGCQVTAETDPALKRRLGGLAYALTGLLRIGDLSASAGVFRDENFEWDGAFNALAIGNGPDALITCWT